MRVTINTTFRNGLADLAVTAERLAEWQRQVSSLQRVQKPSDDPSAAAVIVTDRSEMAALDQFRQTTDSVESRLTVVDAYLTDIVSTLTAAQTTAAAARSTVVTPDQRQTYAQQLRSLRDTILQDINGQYRGAYLFSGTDVLTRPFSKDGAGSVQAYAGNSTAQQLDVDRTRAVAVSFDGGAIAGDLFQVLEALATAIESGDMVQIDAGLQGLDAAFSRVTTAQSRVGLVLGDLDEHRMRLDAHRRAADTRRSSLEDANLADAITRMQLSETAYRAALGALATNGRLSLMDYLQ